MEAFYIAKMKYEHEARLSTPGQQVGKRAGLGYGGLENRPLGKEHILDLPLLHHALGEEGRQEVHGVWQEDGAHRHGDQLGHPGNGGHALAADSG